MTTIILENESYKATFMPDKGMNLISLKKGDIEVIEQTTWSLFEERYAGLGALIGPHFHRRKSEIIPKIQDESLFPHIARVKSKGIQDPFSHGIARYAPWKVDSSTRTKIKATLSGKDTWNGVLLAVLEGQNFKMELTAELKENGLSLSLSIVSDTDSLVGIHYYYALPDGKGKVTSEVQNTYLKDGKEEPIPKEWSYDAQQKLTLNMDRDLDFTFHPLKKIQGDMLLETSAYKLHTKYNCICEENSWQLYHPKDAKFVCIEPVSSWDPRHPNLTVSSLNIHLEIQTPTH